MDEIYLDKDFGYLLNEAVQYDDKNIRYLFIKGKSKDGHFIKKKGKETEKFTLKNIKNIDSAIFGTKENNSIDVTDKLKLIIKEKYIKSKFYHVNESFLTFCNSFLKVLCPRCYNAYAKAKLNPHNHGYFNMCFLTSPKETWNHLFDGFIKCFIAFSINNDKSLISKKKERFIECFSDILVNVNKNNLPHFEISNSIYRAFVNNSKLDQTKFKEYENKIKLSTLASIKILFQYIFPSLKYFHENRDKIFIRHGLEKKTNDYEKNMIFPPNDEKHGWRINKVTNILGKTVPSTLPAYPIEVDKLPLTHCAAHSNKEIYGNVKGFISANDFKKLGGKIHIRYEKNDNVMPRDHFFAESNINLKHWVFTYRNSNENKLKKEIRQAVSKMIEQEIPVMYENIIISYSSVMDLITYKFILLH